MASDPAHVGGAPEDVAVAVVEYVAEGRRGVDEVAGRGVKHAFRLTRRPTVEINLPLAII